MNCKSFGKIKHNNVKFRTSVYSKTSV